VRPRAAVISVGEHNPFGHPSKRTLSALRARGVKIYRTDVEGAVTVETDGQRWSIGAGTYRHRRDAATAR